MAEAYRETPRLTVRHRLEKSIKTAVGMGAQDARCRECFWSDDAHAPRFQKG